MSPQEAYNWLAPRLTVEECEVLNIVFESVPRPARNGLRYVGLELGAEPVRRWLRHDWLIQRYAYDDGDTNIIWGFAYIELIRPKFCWQWYKYDGLPVRRICIGPVALGWGKTHEWFSCG